MRRRLSPRRYRVVCGVALALLSLIVVTGAAVRLTGSGLGCDDWPNCNATRLIDVSSTHAAIEQVNRLFTGLVALGVILAVLGSVVRAPRRRDLTLLSLGLVAGVIGQIVLGGITVLVELHPAAVQGHFLLSMVLVANAVWLVHRAGVPDELMAARPRRHAVGRALRGHVLVAAAATAAALVFGTIVTGAGPHAGDENARRYAIEIGTAARMHAVSVWVAVAVVVALMWRLRALHRDRQVLEGVLVAWACVASTQGAIGYLQYFSGVPAALVAVHVAGATLLWGVTVWAVAVATAPTGPAGSGGQPLHEGGQLVDDAREERAGVGEEVGEHLGAP